MSGSNMGDWFGGSAGGSTRGSGQSWPMSGLWEAMEQLRGQFEQKVGGGTRMGAATCAPRCSRCSPRSRCTATRSSSEIEERSGGSWKPSPGSVYPTLQLLADEGLIKAEESSGRKTYSLTEEGREVADAAGEKSAPWEALEHARAAVGRAHCRRPASTSLRRPRRSGARAARSR